MNPDLARRQRQMMRRRMARQVLNRRLRDRGDRERGAPAQPREPARQ